MAADKANRQDGIPEQSPGAQNEMPQQKQRPRAKKNRPVNNRVVIIIAIAIGVVLLYIMTTISNEGGSSGQRQTLKVSDYRAATPPSVPVESPTAESDPTSESSEDTKPVEMVLSPEGKLIPKTISEGALPAKEEQKTRIVYKAPSDRYQAARNKMLAALHSESKIPMETPAPDTNVNLDREVTRRGSAFGESPENQPSAQSEASGGYGDFDTNATAMAHQDRNISYLAGKTGIGANVEDEYVKSTRRPPVGRYELKAGSIISGVMLGGINSDLPGTILGQVSEHVYDTATGGYILIPQGSRMVGEYDSHVVFGQKRILVVWNRIVYPDGTSLNLEGMLGSDQAGYSGFKQKIDNHYMRMIGAALFASVFVTIGKMATENDKNADGTQTQGAEAVMETMANLGAKIAEKNLDIAPTLRILPGYRFSIINMRDIVFPEPYYVR
jgi:type IV secretion system protein VirB10